MAAKIMFLVDQPGPMEMRQRKALAGDLYRRVSKALAEARAGQVSYATALPKYYGPKPSVRLALAHRNRIDTLLANFVAQGGKVIITAGPVATFGVLGLSNLTKIAGGVYEPRLGLYAVPCLDPRTIVQTKIQAEWLLVARIFERAVQIAHTGKAPDPLLPRINTDINAAVDDIKRAKVIYVDTEYDIETKVPFLVGLTTNMTPQPTVYSLKPTVEVVNKLRGALHWRHTLVAHNCGVDRDALARLGISTTQEQWRCTMLAQATLFPDLRVGLGYTALYWLDNVTWWKDMEHNDPIYNAIDVAVLPLIWYAQNLAMGKLPKLQACYLEEVMPMSFVAQQLETGGLYIDREAQQRLLTQNKLTRKRLLKEIETYTAQYNQKRIDSTNELIRLATAEVASLEARMIANVDPVCKWPKHLSYTGDRKKRWIKDPGCTCKAIFEGNEGLRNLRKEAKLVLKKYEKKLEGYNLGFRPGNNHDLRWFLYDHSALGLPVQRLRGKPTANADAVKKLATTARVRSRADYEEIVAILGTIKEYQHQAKQASTFLNPEVDEEQICHAPVRIWGAGTGRPASGQDSNLADDRKSTSTYKFNAFNLPNKVRCIVAPRPVELVA